MKKVFILSLIGGLFSGIFLSSCARTETGQQSFTDAPFFWENANIYFLLTDRFKNGDPSNDVNFNRSEQTAKLRGFEGGDIKGVIQKIQEGYFDKLGKFRRDHPSVGAGSHQMLQQKPYIFSRTFERNGYSDKVLVGMDLDKGRKKIAVKSLFPEGTELYDYYSDTFASVSDGEIKLDSDFQMALLGIKNRQEW